MFQVIGGAVVYGLALYGVKKLIGRVRSKEVIQSGANQGGRSSSESTPNCNQVSRQTGGQPIADPADAVQ